MLDDAGSVAGPRATTLRRRILVIPGADGIPNDLLSVLEHAFAVELHGGAMMTAPSALAPDVAAVLVAARWDVMDEAVLVLRELRRVGSRAPIALLTRGDVRSADRAHAYRVGFDDVLSDTVGPAELAARMTTLALRGRSVSRPLTSPDGPSEASTSDDASGFLPEGHRLRLAVEAAVKRGDPGLFSVVLLDPGEPDVDALAGLVRRTIRAGSGDLAAVVGERVAVFLPGTRRVDATALVRRLSGDWRRAKRGELRVVQLAYPDDLERLRADLRLPALALQSSLTE